VVAASRADGQLGMWDGSLRPQEQCVLEVLELCILILCNFQVKMLAVHELCAKGCLVRSPVSFSTPLDSSPACLLPLPHPLPPQPRSSIWAKRSLLAASSLATRLGRAVPWRLTQARPLPSPCLGARWCRICLCVLAALFPSLRLGLNSLRADMPSCPAV
jgi:hypothetical protein